VIPLTFAHQVEYTVRCGFNVLCMRLGKERGSRMASPAGVSKTITLEEFLRMPEIDEHPHLEFIDGRIEAKGEST